MNQHLITTVDEFLIKFTEYYLGCTSAKRLPTVPGFCAFTGMSRNYYNQCLKNPIYSYTFEKIDCMLEDAAINCDNKNSSLYLRTRFGYDQRIDEAVETTSNTLEDLIKKAGDAHL